MSVMDFNGADAPRSPGELIPHNTPAMVVMTLRPGGFGAGGWLKNSRDGGCLMLDCEFTVDGGPNNKRKFWTMMVVEGETQGQKQAVDISRGHLRAILESARGILPGDTSEQAMIGRRLGGWGDLDGLRFPAQIAVERGKLMPSSTDRYPDKNVLGKAVTPDSRDYVSPGSQQAGQATATGAATAQTGQMGASGPATGAVSKPPWAA